MASNRIEPIIHYLRTTMLRRDEAGLSDGQLMERFVAQRDAAAFEALVRRHGRMVLGVCRRILGDPHDADDCFQATFLVLVRKAASVFSWPRYHDRESHPATSDRTRSAQAKERDTETPSK
jgi:DNA-directed RNA polymerase specialized sigma24 family protein